MKTRPGMFNDWRSAWAFAKGVAVVLLAVLVVVLCGTWLVVGIIIARNGG
jgi:hypothetical protein